MQQIVSVRDNLLVMGKFHELLVIDRVFIRIILKNKVLSLVDKSYAYGKSSAVWLDK